MTDATEVKDGGTFPQWHDTNTPPKRGTPVLLRLMNNWMVSGEWEGASWWSDVTGEGYNQNGVKGWMPAAALWQEALQ